MFSTWLRLLSNQERRYAMPQQQTSDRPRLSLTERDIVTRCILYSEEAGFTPIVAHTHDGMNKAGSSLNEVILIVEHFWCEVTVLFRTSDERQNPAEYFGSLILFPGRETTILGRHNGPDEFVGSIDRAIVEMVWPTVSERQSTSSDNYGAA